jgi:hypothetical protein
MNVLKLIVLSAAMISLAACSATPTRRSFSESWRDSTVTSQVKWKFIDDKLVKERNIRIETWRGVVTMTGRATSEEEKVRAEELARTVANVADVRNYIDVVANEMPARPEAEKAAGQPRPEPPAEKEIADKEISPEPVKAPEKVVQQGPVKALEPEPQKLSAKKALGGEAIERPVPGKRQNGVSYEIGKELAVTGEDAVESAEEGAPVDDITRQAEEELKELRAKKKR